MNENSDRSSMEVDGVVTNQLEVATTDEEGALAQMFEPLLPTPLNDIGLSTQFLPTCSRTGDVSERGGVVLWVLLLVCCNI